MLNELIHKENETVSSGTTVTVREPIALRAQAMRFLADKHNKQHRMPGLQLARIRGRGIEFDTTREYQAGDDIRSMAWRVTARSLKPHIKVYHEERDRPVWLAIDVSPSLFFGTRCMFKSVCSIRQAALSGWEYLLKRERIGAIIATDQATQVYKPKTSEQHYLSILSALAECSTYRPVFNDQHHLHNLLLALQQQTRTGNQVLILSDFYQFNDENKKLIAHLTERTQVTLYFVYDPLEAEAPPPYQYSVTDGKHNSLFEMDNDQARLRFQQQFIAKKEELVHFSRLHNISLKMIRTDQQSED